MKSLIYIRQFIIVVTCCCMSSCEDFIEVDLPDSKIVSEVVYSNDETAMGAMKGIYNELYRSAFSRGTESSVTILGGLSADNLKVIGTTRLNELEFEQNEILPSNTSNVDLWSSAYNMIYMVNSLLEGLTNSEKITEEVYNRLEGEAKFVRAFTYFYLVNFYGDVPLLLTTNYQKNAVAVRTSKDSVYQQVVADLMEAINVLGESYINGERTHINAFVAKALLARVYLYQKKWTEAENLSSEVISQTGTYKILDDLNEVFLSNSQEAIWQISPIGRGGSLTNTNEGAVFIIDSQSLISHFKLSNDLVNTFGEEDKRLSNWIGFNEERGLYYSYKYKIRNSTADITEYSMVLRLAEQYLIRAEARAMQGNLMGAIEDLDIIRNRAGIELIAKTYPTISKEVLLNTILKEKRKELFTEWGHRWLDIKRIDQADQVFGIDNPLWRDTDVLYPIPEEERIKNPNLSQNLGY